MTIDVDSRLTNALQADAPPELDALFRMDVLVRLERARFRRRLTSTLAMFAVAGALVAVNAEAIDAWMAFDERRAWIVAGVAAVGLFGLLGVAPGAPPGLRAVFRAVGRWLFV